MDRPACAMAAPQHNIAYHYALVVQLACRYSVVHRRAAAPQWLETLHNQGKNMKKSVAAKKQNPSSKQKPLATPTDLKAAATQDIAGVTEPLANHALLAMKFP